MNIDKVIKGLGILKKKSEDHGANVCTTDGRLPDVDYENVGNAPTPIKDNGQHGSYYILCDEERAKGFVRPVRRAYKHVGAPAPVYPLRDLTDAEKEKYKEFGYVKYEEYPPEKSPVVGRYYTQYDLDRINAGCNTVTTMGQKLAETYARDPQFYGGTFCCRCQKHLPVGEVGEFVWEGTNERVGT